MLKNLAGLWRHRALAYVLVARELKARYRGSVLGFFWSLLNPLLMLAVYAVVFAVIFTGRGPATSPYALFLFSGLLPWNWLSSSLTDAAASLTTHGALLKKILFPAEVLPLVAVLAQGLHFVFALPVLLAGLVLGALGAFGPSIPLGWPLVQAVPLFVLEGVFVAGVGLLLAALTVHFRDVKDLLATALSLWFFATPILYTLTDVKQERVRALLLLNPAAPFFDGWHDALFYARWIEPSRWGLLLAIACVTF
ncbi:MAG: ABC transporter permease, partial [Thermoanaerobaculia bacterium]